MFKAIGKWGSQVRSSINLQFFSNLFGSKSKKYDDLDNEEEVFIDAQEDISEESDSEHDKVTSMTLDSFNTEKSDHKADSKDGEIDHGDVTDVKPVGRRKKEIIAQADVVVDTGAKDGDNPPLSDTNLDLSSHRDVQIVRSHSDSELVKHESEEECEDDDDDHHINHKDTKKIVKESKQSNGLVHSASAAVIHKVHRRMNSYSQRQYSKFDNAHDDENDNIIHIDREAPEENDDSRVNSDYLEQENVIKTEKKTKRKKKVAFFQFFRGLFRLNSRPASTRIS